MASDMRSDDRALARKHLDKKLGPMRDLKALARPPKGWIKAIREALGMSAKQLGKRMDVAAPRIYEIEKSELSGVLTLGSLERAAHAMDCQVVYALIPKKDLQETVEQRARLGATRRVRATSHTMALEDQALEESELQEQVDKLTQELLSARASQIWEDQ